MKTKFRTLLAIFGFFVTFQAFGQVTIIGPTTICPLQPYTYTFVGQIPQGCGFGGFNPNTAGAMVSGSGLATNVTWIAQGPDFLNLTYDSACLVNVGTPENPVWVTQPYTLGYLGINVIGVQNVTLTPSIASFPCAATAQTFTVTAASVGANQFNWTVSGGGTIVTETTGNVVTISKPANCAGDIVVTCNARFTGCAYYPGRTQSVTIPVAATLPTAISGSSSMCGTSTNTYSVTAGPNSCWTYNWYFSAGGTGMVISNPSSASTTISYGAGASQGNKVLNCTINACGRSITLTKNISVCAAVAAPTDIAYSRQGTTCYYKFTTPAVCASYYEWQVNNGPIESNAGTTITPYEPGTYTVKVRIVNPCGTSPWRTETWTLTGNWTGCNWKSAPGEVDHEITADPQAAASNESLDFAIIPNPTGGSRNVEIQCAAELVGGTIELYGINGAKVFAGKVEATQFSLNTASIESGLYICRITKGEKMATRKLVVSE